jgi:3-hydroxymyristoyl/3-hydroxydecanoyl-(acyl carrier protein) dehydratase
VCLTLDVPADHPAFVGHFPGRPVLPGAVLLAMVIDALDAQPALRGQLGSNLLVAQVKFLRPVGPGTTLALELRRADPPAGGIDFGLRCGPQPVARGRLETLR